MKYVEVEIKKPMYGTYCQVRDMYINKAIKQGKKLRITIPQGVGVVDPKDWKKTGKKYEKVFRFPDNPMILYGNYVPIEGTMGHEDFDDSGGDDGLELLHPSGEGQQVLFS